MAKTILTPDTFRLDVVRPNDLVVLSFRFRDMTLDEKRGGPQLVPGPGGLILVDLPPQAFAEEFFSLPKEKEGPPEPSPPPPPTTPGRVDIRIARPSRLVFRAPEKPFPYTLDALLKACRGAQIVTARRRSGKLFPATPPPDATAIEIPYGLLLSPGGTGAWAHATAPEFGSGSFALWHTRLGSRGLLGSVNESAPKPGGTGDPGRSARAAWSGSDPAGLSTALSGKHRQDLVDYGNDKDLPAIRVDRLMLSALGGWFEGGLSIEQVPAGRSLKEWEHRMTMGREHFVRTVAEGFLFPYGHAATVTDVFERKVHNDRAAYFTARRRLLIREPVRTYVRKDGMPFRQVEITERVTPQLFVSKKKADFASEDGSAFWVMLASDEDFLFHLVGTDWAGREVSFTSPLVFVPNGMDIGTVASQYATASDTRRVRPMSGQLVTYTEADVARTTFDTVSLEFTATGAGRPVPQLRNAIAPIPAVRSFTGKEQIGFSYHEAFRLGGKNPLEVFALLTNPAEGQATFDPATSGGVVTPDMAISSLSLKLGPLGGGSTIEGGRFEPGQFFGTSANLFGAVPLSSILAPRDVDTKNVDEPADPTGKQAGKVPVIPSMVSDGPNRVRLSWSTTMLQETAVFAPRTGARLSLEVVRTTSRVVESSTWCSLSNFDVRLPLITIPFVRFEYQAEVGRKVDLSVELGDVRFTGELEFLNTLATLVQATGFVDPPAIEVTDTGVTAGYTLAIPSAAFGVFNLQNLALSAFAHLPLVAGPENQMRVSFAISERQNPFLVTVSAFGGAGFFALEMGLGGISVLEASLEFGGALAMNIGIAAGGVTLMAGIYYANVEGSSALSGFVRINGVLEVLGIVSISAQFFLELRWEKPKVWGAATLTVKVSVAFFSKSVSLPVRREFANSPAPSFGDMVDARAWATYCDSFASDK